MNGTKIISSTLSQTQLKILDSICSTSRQSRNEVVKMALMNALKESNIESIIHGEMLQPFCDLSTPQKTNIYLTIELLGEVDVVARKLGINRTKFVKFSLNHFFRKIFGDDPVCFVKEDVYVDVKRNSV